MTDQTQPAPDSFFIPCVILTACLAALIIYASIATSRMDAAREAATQCRAELAALVQP